MGTGQLVQGGKPFLHMVPSSQGWGNTDPAYVRDNECYLADDGYHRQVGGNNPVHASNSESKEGLEGGSTGSGLQIMLHAPKKKDQTIRANDLD